MIKTISVILSLTIAIPGLQALLLRDRNLLVKAVHPSDLNHPTNRRLANMSALLGAEDVETMAEHSRISDFEARQMAVNASQKQQRLAHLLTLVNGFKSSMDDVTNTVNSQISQINGLLLQAKG